ncbi:MAG TPA: helix-turn-helix domain-containing protein [Caulobacteraceae bacterium]|nr:helix-turn-helix domain-containing protein [Caulobacteraceae bacterium]
MNALARARPTYEDLEAENAWLRAQLAERAEAEEVAHVACALRLPPTPALLLLFLQRRGHRYTSKAFLDEIFPTDGDEGRAPNTWSVHVWRIRRALGFDAVETLWGFGYRLTPTGRARLAEVRARDR